MQQFKVGQKVKVNSGIIGTVIDYNNLTGVIKEVDDNDNTIRLHLDDHIHRNDYWVFPNDKGVLDVEILEDVQAVELPK